MPNNTRWVELQDTELLLLLAMVTEAGETTFSEMKDGAAALKLKLEAHALLPKPPVYERVDLVQFKQLEFMLRQFMLEGCSLAKWREYKLQVQGYLAAGVTWVEGKWVNSAAEKLKRQAEVAEEEEKRRGQVLADWLQLKKNEAGRYDLTIGDKTELGLYRTVKRLIQDGK